MYSEIEKAYENESSIFDNITKEDCIFAFFPCTRFENQIILHFNGNARQQKNWSEIEKLENCIKLHQELHKNYTVITKLCIVAYRRGFKLIIENPYSEQHYLVRYWSIKSTIKDLDRTIRGDYYKKPTQYWFINCSPTYRPLFENPIYVENIKKISTTGNKVERSMISKEYANRFIREFVL